MIYSSACLIFSAAAMTSPWITSGEPPPPPHSNKHLTIHLHIVVNRFGKACLSTLPHFVRVVQFSSTRLLLHCNIMIRRVPEPTEIRIGIILEQRQLQVWLWAPAGLGKGCRWAFVSRVTKKRVAVCEDSGPNPVSQIEMLQWERAASVTPGLISACEKILKMSVTVESCCPRTAGGRENFVCLWRVWGLGFGACGTRLGDWGGGGGGGNSDIQHLKEVSARSDGISSTRVEDFFPDCLGWLCLKWANCEPWSKANVFFGLAPNVV